MNILLNTNRRTTLFWCFDKWIVFNDQDHKKMDRGKETHVLAGVWLLGTVQV